MSLKEWFGKGPKGDWVGYKRKKKGWKPPSMRTEKGFYCPIRLSEMCASCKSEPYEFCREEEAVRRKRAKAQGVGGKPTNVRTDVPKKTQKKQHTGVRSTPVVALQDGRCTDVKMAVSIRQWELLYLPPLLTVVPQLYIHSNNYSGAVRFLHISNNNSSTKKVYVQYYDAANTSVSLYC